MDEVDARLSHGKTSVFCDAACIARRKRMEIIKFKKLSRSTKLHYDPLSIENGAVCPKRSRSGQSSIDFEDFQDDDAETMVLLPSLCTEEAQTHHLSKGKEPMESDCVPSLHDTGLVRYKSLPPFNIHINKAQRCSTDPQADRRGNGQTGERRGRLMSGELKQKMAGPSFSELTTCTSLMASYDKEERDRRSSDTELENSLLITEPGTLPLSPCGVAGSIVLSSDTDMVDLTDPPSFTVAADGSVASASRGVASSLQTTPNGYSPRVDRTDPPSSIVAAGGSVASASQSVASSLQAAPDGYSYPGVDLTDPPSMVAADGSVASASQSNSSSLQAAPEGYSPYSGRVLLCGRRRDMEDAATIAPSFSRVRRDLLGSCLCSDKVQDRPTCDLHFFGVYDGHGGAQASSFCRERLHHVLAEELLHWPAAAAEGDVGAREGSSSPSMWWSVMTSCFQKVDQEVGGACPLGKCTDAYSAAPCCSNSIAPENVGTTATIGVVSSCQIVVANCGDSRAVLSRDGRAIPLSRDHKPNRDDEYSRIEAAGGRVIDWDGHRVEGLLAVSRAIGDRHLKRFVISEPEVTCLQRAEEDECLILATDGLWDKVSNELACKVARISLDRSRRRRVAGQFRSGEDPACADVAALLVKLAFARGSKDNISVVVIDLKQ